MNNLILSVPAVLLTIAGFWLYLYSVISPAREEPGRRELFRIGIGCWAIAFLLAALGGYLWFAVCLAAAVLVVVVIKAFVVHRNIRYRVRESSYKRFLPSRALRIR